MVKNLPANAEDMGAIFGSGRSSGGGNGNWLPTPVCFLENPMDREAWWATVGGVIKSWTRLSMHRHTVPYSTGVQHGWERLERSYTCWGNCGGCWCGFLCETVIAHSILLGTIS